MISFIMFGIFLLFLFLVFYKDDVEELINPMLFFAVISIFTAAFSYYIQLYSWTNYLTIDSKIVNAEQTRDSLAKKIDTLKIPQTALMNGDSPYTATINTLTEVEKEVLALRQIKISIQKYLLTGELGLNNFWAKLARPEGVDVNLRELTNVNKN